MFCLPTAEKNLLFIVHVCAYCLFCILMFTDFRPTKTTYMSFAQAITELFPAENVVSNYSDFNKRSVLKPKTKTARVSDKSNKEYQLIYNVSPHQLS